MFRFSLKSIAGCALLVLAAASPSLALTLGVVPVRPTEKAPFTLLVGGMASCPSLDTIGFQEPRIVNVRLLLNQCPTLPQPFLLEIPIPPLARGEWTLQVSSNELLTEKLKVNVEQPPYQIGLDPPTPQPGSPFTLRVTGNGDCPGISSKIEQDGNLISLLYFDDCGFPTISDPEPFVIEVDMQPLPAGDYVVQVTDGAQNPLASHRFQVPGLSGCIPSETALCLLQGRFRVEAVWRAARGEGAARAHPVSGNFGAFSLADPHRHEVFVGLHDTCATPTRTVWIAAHWPTDAEVEITVTEVATGEVRRYDNLPDLRLAPVWDPMAFLCPFVGVGGETVWRLL